MSGQKAKAYTHVIKRTGPPDVRNFLADCYALATDGPRRPLTGNYPVGIPGPTSLSSQALDVFSICYKLECIGITPPVAPNGDGAPNQLAAELLNHGFRGEVTAVEKILYLVAQDHELRHAMPVAWDELIAELRRNTLYTEAGIEEPTPKRQADKAGAPAATKRKANGKGKQKKGAPRQYDPADDKRLCAHWKAAKGQGSTREEFARERGITVNDIIAAQNREKYRRQRDAE
jgi:hypothetical protein